ncbi:hypothetical protein [Alteribacter populi]|uniref:hypothetical protein n=1 Tax=Alteribacter populi TaxID=2011011 RepID=UPI000BBA9003|nr:hypothetical protein [Alteribacter populi]
MKNLISNSVTDHALMKDVLSDLQIRIENVILAFHQLPKVKQNVCQAIRFIDSLFNSFQKGFRMQNVTFLLLKAKLSDHLLYYLVNDLSITKESDPHTLIITDYGTYVEEQNSVITLSQGILNMNSPSSVTLSKVIVDGNRSLTEELQVLAQFMKKLFSTDKRITIELISLLEGKRIMYHSHKPLSITPLKI